MTGSALEPSAQQDPVAPLGAPAPDFTLTNQHGELVRLSTLRGSPVLVVFFPAAFTGVCTGELRALRQHQPDFDALGARLLAISTDTMFALRVFSDSEQLTFPLLSDFWPHGAVAQAYGVFDFELGSARRASFVVDAGGTIRWSVLSEISKARDVADQLAAVAAEGG
ncbi:peroxiredoxin [Microlunatus panaciterrae]|uniref:Peroxiredoxin n=1 Tax=Microlunatus panaciterrae TaxID=400768 RepID=A0ABS2RGD3_9ACTN|nr:peroxiredoxin [Microlunatus panaciterrae]